MSSAARVTTLVVMVALRFGAGCNDSPASVSDGGPIATEPSDGGTDSGALADGGAIDATTDAAVDSAPPLDSGTTSACTSAGGTCVAEDAGACATGLVGGPAYACGGGALACCLPRNTPPTCGAIGTKSEGWYAPDGKLLCYTTCAAATLTCEAIGTRSEGWYATPASAACPPPPDVPRLVQWTDCSP
ncbi:MAG: hypothetical protein U0183_13830 [Polyangiaceae bacterium]